MNECGPSNFFAVDYGCVPRSKTVDFCGSESITGQEIHVSFSGEQPPNFSDSTNGCRKTCSCTATSASGNRLSFGAVDIRLQKPSTDKDNIQCSGTRLKLSDSPEQYFCRGINSLRYSETSGVITSLSGNVDVDLMDIGLDDYPASVWIFVRSLLQGDNVTVSCHNPTNTDPMCGVTTTPVPTTQFVPNATLILAILLPILAVIIILAIIGACCFKRRQAWEICCGSICIEPLIDEHSLCGVPQGGEGN